MCTAASGQSIQEAKASIAIDIASMLTDGCIRLRFGHSFSARWSAEGSASLPMPETESCETDRTHGAMLEDRDVHDKKQENDSCPEFRMGIRFWPSGFMEGFHCGIGCSHRPESGTDMTAGLGYSFRVWKRIGIVMGYEIRLMESIGKGTFNAEGIEISINYRF